MQVSNPHSLLGKKVKNLEKKLLPKEKEIYEKLKEVKDPELVFSIVEANLKDEINKALREI